MSGFSQNITSPFPNENILFNSASGATAQQLQANQLLNQGRQLDLSNANMEQVSRVAAALRNEPDLAKRAELYPRYIGMLQSQGYALHAPPTLPDDQTLQMLAAQGVSSEKQYEYGAGRSAAQSALGGGGTPGGGTGTGTAATPPAGSVATAPSATIEAPAFNNATAVRDGLIKRGMDPDTATAVAANALHESVANPRTGRGDNGNSAGLLMWQGPRLQAYIDKYGHPPDGSPLDEQLDFMMSELSGSESDAAAKIAAAQGPAAKAAAVSQFYLRPKDTAGEIQRRSATALQLQRQLGGGTGTAAATPATTPPGGVSAPGVVTGDAARPDLAPAPPGGTAGAYPATGGGIGTVLGGAAPAARPTSPPVITDQPAGGAVVAGPPGTAVVGQPRPPSAAVPGNVNAINAGIARAGGTTAQAAEPGWGTAIGSYGPQSTPASPPAPAPAAAPPAATVAPASTAPALVPQVPLEPMLQLNARGLTAPQEKARTDALTAGAVTPARVQQIVQHYEELANANVTANRAAQTANFQRQREAQNDARQAVQDQAAAVERERVAAQQAEQLALSKKADARAEAEAKRAGLPTGYRLDDSGKAYRIDGLPPDPAVLEAQANAGRQAQRQFDQENTLRDEFQKLTSDFRIVQTSFENIRSAAKANDGAGDMSLLYNYVRLLDPTSVVRESEFAAAAASGSLGERVQTAYERIASGARMPESLRQSFIREGRNLYDNQLRSHNTVADQYEQLARDNGLEPKRVVTRFARPQDDAQLPPPDLSKKPPGFNTKVQ